MKQIFRYFSVLMMLIVSVMASAESTIKVVKSDYCLVKIGTNSASTEIYKGTTVFVTVTPFDGFYFQKEDLAVVKTVNPYVAGTRGEIPIAGAIDLSGSDPADLSTARTYSFIVPDDGYEFQISAICKARTTITDDMVTLSATSFTYNGSDQKPTISVTGLTEGTDYTVSFAESAWKEVGTYSVSISGISKYQGTVTKTFTISAADGSLTPPIGKSGLVYTGAAQDLITAGSSTTGTMQYSLDGTNYNASIPQGTDAKDYTVYYKVVANAGYNDVGPSSFKVTISPKTLSSPTITLSETSYTYDGQAKEPTVTVKDGDATIPASEYTVSYKDNKEVGTATVTITDKEGGNYTVSGSATFSITAPETPSIVNNEEPVTVDGQTLYEPSEEVVEAIKETIETDIALPAAAEGRVEVTDDGGLKFSQGEDLLVALLDLKLKDIVKFIFTGRLFGDSSKLRLKNGNGGGTRVAGDMELISEAEYEVIEAGDQIVTVKLEETEATVETITITEQEKAVSVKISSAKQVAYCSDKDLDFNSKPELKAYVATGYDKTTGTIWLTRVKDVPANTGFLLMGDPGTYDVPVKEGGSNSYYTNMFKGTIEATTIQTTETIDGKEYTNYYLSNGDQGVGFYKVTKTGGQSLPANRAYLSVPSGIPAVGSAGSTETIKVTAAGQVPYYSANSLDFTDMADVKAYTATGYDYKSSTIWLTRVKKVPALTGILIMAPEGSYPIPTASVATVYGNMFKGTLGGTTIQAIETIAGVDYINYYLSNGNYGVGFYKVTNPDGQNLPANRCYLPIPKQTASTRGAAADPTDFSVQESDEVIALRVFGSAEGTTGIDTNNRETITNNHWFNLQGQRVENPGKGLYIRNGKKFIIR